MAGLAAACLLGIFCGSAPAADLQSRLDAKQAKLEQVQAHEGVLTTTISRYEDQISSLESAVAALRRQEAAVHARLVAKQAELNQAIADLRRARAHLEIVRGHLRRALVTLREQLVAIYESGTPDVLTVLLSSRGFDDMVARAEYLKRIQGSQESVVSRVRQLRNEVKRTVIRLAEARRRIEAARDAIAAQEQQLASARASVESRKADLVAARAKRESALAQIRDSEQALEGDVSAIQGKIQAQIAAASAVAPLPAGPIGAPSSSGFIWPVDGAVVSGFGMRWGRMHEGVDIAVPAGTPIRAAASGTVILMQSDAESGGYGNYTCIDHGGGLSSCYAHQSSFATSTGAAVSQGDLIGYVGCTGHCFGDHLHFEVRVNGAAVDPMGYL
ncbi:MAG: murein hydrolase activator EnvC family protein [Solirubrobacterales bacterium]